MSERVQIKCPKCGADMSVHQPAIVRIDNGLMSQVTLMPSWSPAERLCPGCKWVVAPILAPEVSVGYVAMEQEQLPAELKNEPSRIIPAGPLPVDITKRLKEVK